MTRNLVTISPDDDVTDVARVMIENNVRRVPVVNEDGELVGIITSFDLVSKALTKITVDDAVENYMITTVPTTWEKAPLNVAFETMNQFGLKSVLALDDDAKLSGILFLKLKLSLKEVNTAPLLVLKETNGHGTVLLFYTLKRII